MQAKNREMKKNSASLRVWHWLNALLILGSLTTVLINSTLLDRGFAMGLIHNEASSQGLELTKNQLRSIWHGFEETVWTYHIYIGYGLAILFVLRLFSEILASKDQRFTPKFKRSLSLYLKQPNFANRYEFGIKFLYLFFYIIFFLMLSSGLTLAFKDNFGIPNDIAHTIKEFHGFCMYLILGFSALHIGGVILAERKTKKGIVSDMINGGKN